jgi:hypothetical protein
LRTREGIATTLFSLVILNIVKYFISPLGQWLEQVVGASEYLDSGHGQDALQDNLSASLPCPEFFHTCFGRSHAKQRLKKE